MLKYLDKRQSIKENLHDKPSKAFNDFHLTHKNSELLFTVYLKIKLKQVPH